MRVQPGKQSVLSAYVNMIIRPARPEDYEAICEVLDEVDALHRDALPQIFRVRHYSDRSGQRNGGMSTGRPTRMKKRAKACERCSR